MEYTEIVMLSSSVVSVLIAFIMTFRMRWQSKEMKAYQDKAADNFLNYDSDRAKYESKIDQLQQTIAALNRELGQYKQEVVLLEEHINTKPPQTDLQSLINKVDNLATTVKHLQYYIHSTPKKLREPDPNPIPGTPQPQLPPWSDKVPGYPYYNPITYHDDFKVTCNLQPGDILR